jgi:hypothetical protein
MISLKAKKNGGLVKVKVLLKEEEYTACVIKNVEYNSLVHLHQSSSCFFSFDIKKSSTNKQKYFFFKNKLAKGLTKIKF